MDGEEGFVPATFRSSRDARAAVSTSQPEDFMEESEREAWKAKHLGVYEEYGTITQAMYLKAKREGSKADMRDKAQHSLGLQGDVATLLAPVTTSVGMRLLGSRTRVPSSVAERDEDIRRSLESMQKMGRKEASDRRGVGCFSLQRVEPRTISRGGPAQLESEMHGSEDETFVHELDIYGAEQEAPGFATIALPGEDSEGEEDQRPAYRPSLTWRTQDPTTLEGFALSQWVQRSADWFPPPKIARKKGIGKVHCKSQSGAQFATEVSDAAKTLPAPPPKDEALKNRIDSLAAYVARNGDAFEQMARSKQAADPKFSFLFGGLGANYYEQRKAALCKALSHTNNDVFHSSGASLTKHSGKEQGTAGSKHAYAKNVDKKETPSNFQAISSPVAAPNLTKNLIGIDKAELHKNLSSQFAPGGARGNAPLPTIAFCRKSLPSQEQKDSAAHSPGAAGRESTVEKDKGPHMFRDIFTWQPNPLVCKRFNIRCPQTKKGKEVVTTKPSASFVLRSTLNVRGDTEDQGTSKDIAHVPSDEMQDKAVKSTTEKFLEGMRNDPILLEHMQQDLVVDEQGGYVRRPIEVFQAIFDRNDGAPGSRPQAISHHHSTASCPTGEPRVDVQEPSGISKKEVLEERIRELQRIFDSKHKERRSGGNERERERNQHLVSSRTGHPDSRDGSDTWKVAAHHRKQARRTYGT